MNVSSWLKNATKTINQLDAELILAHILGVERTFLHAHPDYGLKTDQEEQASQALRRRATGEPLAYITGAKDFYGRQFIVSRDVLIPRPETEALIEVARRLARASILDVGTGSGCIAITLAKELPGVMVTAVDISDKALDIARENALKHQAKVDFRHSDLLSGLDNVEKYDLIVANLPYVDRKWDWLGPELAFEPETALYAEDDGLEQIKELIRQAPMHLEQGGHLVLEADRSQHQKIANFALETGNFTPVKPISDAEKSALALVLRLRSPRR
ncbi:peptide chain release factor N(5)-glutamine methyltransferase [Candidatus Saccharibacteria bacterium]|nr:peptide chain release factor N(5)-glutamine methyltransferase [Candidatus Saccharibacteria bacterium]